MSRRYIALPGGSFLGFRDLLIPGTAAGAGATAPTFGAFSGNISAFRGQKFAATGAPATYESLSSLFHINHDYAIGTPVFFHVHWQPSAAMGATSVVWRFRYSMARGNVDVFPALQNVDVTTVQNLSQGAHCISETASVTIANLEPDALVVVVVQRVHDDASDTFTGDAELFTFDMHYQADSFVTDNRVRNSSGDAWDK